MLTLARCWVLVTLVGCLPSDFDDAAARVRQRSMSGAVIGGGVVRLDAGVHRVAPSVDAGGARAAAVGGVAGAAGVLSGGRGGGGAGAGGKVAAAGRGGMAGKAAAAPSGGAGVAGKPPAAPSGGAGARGESGSAAESCGDTTSDAANCGSCGHDCSASMALGSCVNSRCARACQPGFRDCNMDLSTGTEGDGCEVEVVADVDNCGGCDLHCQTEPGTVGYCDNARCMLHEVEIEAGSAVDELHGNTTGGEPYAQVCGQGEALVGIDVATNGDYIWGLAVRCAPLLLTGTEDAFTIETGPSHALALLGNRALPVQTPMTLECPPNMLVSSVTGATGYFLPDNVLLSLKTLSLLCARTQVQNGDVSFVLGGSRSAGSLMGNVAEPFSDICPSHETVVGFNGRAGDVIDALVTVCAPIEVGERAQ